MNSLSDTDYTFYQRLSRFVSNKIQNRADAEEVTQDIMLKFITSIESKEIENLTAWAMTIARNTIIDFYKRKQIDTTHILENLESHATDSQDHNEVADCMRPLMKLLPQEDQDLLIAVEFEGLSQKAYAKHHKLPYSTVKSKVQRARKKLKDELQKCCHLEFDQSGLPIDCYKPNCQ